MSHVSSHLATQTEEHKRVFPTRVDLGMLAVALIWGTNFAVVKQALNEVAPLVFVSVRFLLAASVLFTIMILSGETIHVERRDLKTFLLISLTGHVIYQVCFIKGIALTTASNSSLLLATSPIFVALLGMLLKVEQITLALGAGIMLSFGGIALIVGLGSGGLSVAGHTLEGNLLTLVAAVCWALSTVLSKPLLRRYSPLKLTAITMLISTPLLLAVSSGELAVQPWHQISTQGWLGVIFSALLANGAAYVLWNISVQKAGTARTAVFSNLVPVIAVILSWFVLDEALGIWQGIGAAVTLCGVTLTRLSPRRARVG